MYLLCYECVWLIIVKKLEKKNIFYYCITEYGVDSKFKKMFTKQSVLKYSLRFYKDGNLTSPPPSVKIFIITVRGAI